MSIAVKGDFNFIGKEELMGNPLTGLFLKTIDIPVDRDSKRSSFLAFKKMSNSLQQGRNLIVFPEGKIGNEYPPILHEFKSGPFRLAIDLKIPIIAVTSLNTWRILWDSGTKFGSRPGICDIYIHKPIETAHLNINDVDDLKNEVYNIINKKFTQ